MTTRTSYSVNSSTLFTLIKSLLLPGKWLYMREHALGSIYAVNGKTSQVLVDKIMNAQIKFFLSHVNHFNKEPE